MKKERKMEGKKEWKMKEREYGRKEWEKSKKVYFYFHFLHQTGWAVHPHWLSLPLSLPLSPALSPPRGWGKEGEVVHNWCGITDVVARDATRRDGNGNTVPLFVIGKKSLFHAFPPPLSLYLSPSPLFPSLLLPSLSHTHEDKTVVSSLTQCLATATVVKL
jgi:hypothetical protein